MNLKRPLRLKTEFQRKEKKSKRFKFIIY